MLQLPAPAKINLFLHITGRRGDGYHNLETLFQLIDYGDTLSFVPNQSGHIRLESNLNTEVAVTDNIVISAAQRLKTETSCDLGVDIRLEKRLPMGGGVGGGSSDAATTLLALNYLWQLNLPVDKLADIGLTLGADVPIFVLGTTAFARGVGEKLLPLELDRKWFLVVTPSTAIATREIFTHPELTRDSSPIKIPPLAVEGGRNDCQAVVENLYPQVAETRIWLEQFAPAFLTGTGASLFSIFETEGEALEVARQLPQNWGRFVARGINQSPVHSRLEQLSS